MINNQRIAEKIYISLYVTCLTLVAIYMISTQQYAGELSQFQHYSSPLELVILLVYSIFGFIGAYFFYKLTKDRKIYLSITPLRVNTTRLTVVFLILLVAQLIFLISTGVGRIGSQATSSYSPVFSLLNIDALFGVFYFLTRKSTHVKKIYFWPIVLTYLAFKILQGWSGVILIIFFFELYFHFNDRYIRSWSRIILIVLLPLLLILSGGKVYHYVFPYKFEIRGMSISEISYTESVVNLTNRLTFYPISVGAYERNAEIQKLAFQDDTLFRETKGFFRPFTPRFIMENKEFRSINNLVIQAFYPDVQASTSSDIGLVIYVTTLLSSNIADSLLWIISTILLLGINKFIIDSFEQYRGQLNFIYFLLIMKLYYTASPEIVFGFGSIGILFFLPLLFATGAVKVKSFKKCIQRLKS